MKLADYAKATCIDEEQFFYLWSPFMLKNGYMIISSVQKWYHNHTNKFGVHIPKMRLLRLKKGNMYWQDVLKPGIKSVCIAIYIK